MTEAVGPGWGDILRTAAALLAVVALAVLFGRLARRGSVLGGRGRRLSVVERLPLTRSAHVVLVEDGERTLLLGVSEKGVSLIRDLGPSRSAAAHTSAAGGPHPGAFAARLAAALRERGRA
ncbi:MAG: hypothetical protein D6718_05650 [Acidobacteria bacterium]|nr:MAG: hypothetical protein D6718_05650 [Acidobacteriota bacterium]